MNALTIHHGTAKPIRVRGRHVCALVAFAEKHRGWHTAKADATTRRALESAKRAGCIETEQVGPFLTFRFVYPSA